MKTGSIRSATDRLLRATRVAMSMVAAVLMLMPGAVAQEEEDLTAGLRQSRGAIARARGAMDELDFAAAIRDLGDPIRHLQDAGGSVLDVEEEVLLSEAYALRARAHFNLGNIKAARADYEALVRLAPGYSIDRQSLSPKVVSLFDDVRSKVAAILMLEFDPPNARVLVDDDPVDLPRSGIALLAGNRTVRIEAEGYDPYEEQMAVLAGTDIRKTVRLRPNSRALQFITSPVGVSILVNGEKVGTTRGPATAATEALAGKYGFDPENASAPLLVPLVKQGRHRVTFERECFLSKAVSIEVTLDLEDNSVMRFAPVILEEALTDLNVRSYPSGADVIIGGERQGVTPVTVRSVCGGDREVEIVKAGVGSWRESVRLSPGQTNVLDIRLRPTLLYAGTFRLDDYGRAVWSDQDQALLDRLGKGLETLNVVRPSDDVIEIREAIVEWMISDPMEVREGTILPPKILDQAARRAGADLVLAGLTLAGDPDKAWTLALYSVLHPTPDIARLRIDRTDGIDDLVRRLDRIPRERRTWWGVGLVDTALGASRSGADGPLVVRVLPGSPAATAGLRVGDRVIRVGAGPVHSAGAALDAMEESITRPGGVRSPVVLEVDDGSGRRTVRIEPGESPVVIPLTDATLLYNRALAEFRLRSRATEDKREKGVALLNLGIAYMHFREYDSARTEGFSRASLPPGSGISAGTVLYYRGLSALRTGDPRGARRDFAEAAEAGGSTLDTGDGPSAAAAARRLLQTLR